MERIDLLLLLVVTLTFAYFPGLESARRFSVNLTHYLQLIDSLE